MRTQVHSVTFLSKYDCQENIVLRFRVSQPRHTDNPGLAAEQEMLRSVMRLLVVVAVCAVADVQGASLRGRAGKLSGAKAHPESARLSPVVFIPGNGGSRLEAKLSSPALARSYGCPERQGWFQLWLNVWDLLLGKLLHFSHFSAF